MAPRDGAVLLQQQLKARFLSNRDRSVGMASNEQAEPQFAGKLLSELLADLEAPDAELRVWSASALDGFIWQCHADGKPIPAAVIRPLIDALSDPVGDVRGWAAIALGTLGKEGRHALPQLIKLLADEREEDGVRAKIAEAVAELMIEADVPILMHGPVADLLVNAEELVSPLRAAGVSFSAECYGQDRELLRELSS